RNACKCGEIVASQRRYQCISRNSAEHGHGEFGPNSAHTDEALEQLLLFATQKSVQRERVLAYMCMDVEGNLRPFGRQSGKTWDTDCDFVADSSGFKNHMRRMLFEDTSAEMSDHGR